MLRKLEKIKCHLVSFADGAFLNRAQRFRQEAVVSGLFDSISIYKYEDLLPAYKIKHGNFIVQNKRGFGYWIWKPQCILQTLDKIEQGDLVVYMDVGFEINTAGNGRMLEYFKIAQQNKFKMLAFSNTHTEYRWTKMDLAKRLGIEADSNYFLTSQLAAGFFVFQYTQDNYVLITQWRDLAVENNYHYSSDATSVLNNHTEFVEHRHDASIFSLLRKLRGTEISHYEVQSYPNFEKLKPSLPAWASRKGREKF